jgi:3-hydroxyisobutyrate dehydrogenase/putative dehydrogenase
MAKVGWLGLGAMGMPMAMRAVAAGHTVTAYDPHSERLRALSERGGHIAAAPADAARGAEVLVLIVATPSQAEEALFGAGAAAEALGAGSDLLVLSTVGPDWVCGARQRLAPDVGLVDAPVSGGVERAARGDLLVMASGHASPISRLLLEDFGDVVNVGEAPGAGQAVKMVNQLLCGVHIAAAAEAIAFAEALGLDALATWDALRRGAAASFMLEDRGSRMVHGYDGPPRSAISLFVKDMRLVLDNAQAGGLPTPLAATAEHLFTLAAAQGLQAHDDSKLVEVFRTWLHRPPSG